MCLAVLGQAHVHPTGTQDDASPDASSEVKPPAMGKERPGLLLVLLEQGCRRAGKVGVKRALRDRAATPLQGLPKIWDELRQRPCKLIHGRSAGLIPRRRRHTTHHRTVRSRRESPRHESGEQHRECHGENAREHELRTSPTAS